MILSNNLDKSKMIQGNTVGNISNGGIAAIQDDWIYYQGYNSDAKKTSIYKEKTDGSEKTEIESESYGYPYINVANDWVYYIKRNPDSLKYSICKMKTDGSEKTDIENNLNSARHLNVVGDWIYYSKLNSDSEKYSICKVKTNGSKKEDIESVQELNVVGDWIYYYNDKTKNNSTIIYKEKMDGSQKAQIYETEIHKINKAESGETKTSSEIISSLNVVGDWIYVTDYDTRLAKYSIYKMKIDGSEKTYIENNVDSVRDFNVVGDWICYSDNSDKIYIIKTDGSQKNFNVSIIAGNWIYGANYDASPGKYSIYKMRKDGSEKTDMENNVDSVRKFNVLGDWIFYSDNSDKIYYIKTDGSQKGKD